MFKTINFLLIIVLLVSALSACAAPVTENQTTESPAVVEISTEAASTETLLTDVPAAETSTVADDMVVVTQSYPIVDTGQSICFDNSDAITCPTEGEAF